MLLTNQLFSRLIEYARPYTASSSTGFDIQYVAPELKNLVCSARPFMETERQKETGVLSAEVEDRSSSTKLPESRHSVTWLGYSPTQLAWLLAP